MIKKSCLSLRGWESTAGEKSKCAVLNNEKVLEIRRLRASKSSAEFAALFGISTQHVRDIWTRRRWASLKDE
jgi:DNA-binding transcriptional regulator YiaG